MKTAKRFFTILLFFAAFLAFHAAAGAAAHGDFDLDGTVTPADARFALRAAVGLDMPDAEALKVSDLDRDNVISPEDARMILRVAVGLDNPNEYHTFQPANNGKFVCSVCGREQGEIIVGGNTISMDEDIVLLRQDFEEILHPYPFLTGEIKDHSFTDPYGNYILALTQSGKIKYLYICGADFSVGNISSGDVISGESGKSAVLSNGSNVYYYTDSNDSDMVFAALIYTDKPVYADFRSAAVSYGAEYIETDITNAYRAIYGLKTLKYNGNVSFVARAHSRDMAEHNFFSHYSLNGDAPWDRARKAGIAFHSFGENIAAGIFMPWDVFDQWVNSPGHREIILSDYNEIGIGLWIDESAYYKFYWTQNFIA